MDKIKTVAKIGIGVAVIDYLLRAFGPLYTTARSEALTADHFIWTGIIPLFAVLSSFGLIKGKKWGFYLSVVFVLISLIGSSGALRGREFNLLAFIYLVVYGVLVFLSFKVLKSLK